MRIWSCCSPVITLAIYKCCHWINALYLSMTGTREETKQWALCVSQSLIRKVFSATLFEAKSFKTIVYLHEMGSMREPEGSLGLNAGSFQKATTAYIGTMAARCFSSQCHVPFDIWGQSHLYHCSLCMCGLERMQFPL